MSGNIYGRADGNKVIPEWNVVVATQDSQVVYGAGLPLTIVPLDSTTLVKLADAERERVRKRGSQLPTPSKASTGSGFQALNPDDAP